MSVSIPHCPCWSFLLGHMHLLSLLPDDSLLPVTHLRIIADARGPPPYPEWVSGIDMQFATLGMACLSKIPETDALESHGFMAKMVECQQPTLDGLHVLGTASFKDVKSCGFHHWFGRLSIFVVRPVMRCL